MDNSPASDQKAVPDRPPVWDMLSPNNYIKQLMNHKPASEALGRELDRLADGVFDMMDKNGFWDQTKPNKMFDKFMAEARDMGVELAQDDADGVARGIEYAIKNLAPEIDLAKHMLVVTEIAEGSEGVRKPGPSDHIPEFTLEEEEMVDAFVRILDYCGRKKLRFGACFFAKMYFNGQRPYKHGKAA